MSIDDKLKFLEGQCEEYAISSSIKGDELALRRIKISDIATEQKPFLAGFCYPIGDIPWIEIISAWDNHILKCTRQQRLTSILLMSWDAQPVSRSRIFRLNLEQVKTLEAPHYDSWASLAE